MIINLDHCASAASRRPPVVVIIASGQCRTMDLPQTSPESPASLSEGKKEGVDNVDTCAAALCRTGTGLLRISHLSGTSQCSQGRISGLDPTGQPTTLVQPLEGPAQRSCCASRSDG